MRDQRRPAPIAMSAEEFRRAGHRLVDTIAQFLESLPERPVTRDQTPEELRALLGAHLPEAGSDASGLLESTAEMLMEHSLFNGHPRFLGYITSAPAPIGILGDFLAAAMNSNVGAWRLSPMATEIEAQTISWLGELVAYPAGGGLLVSGGNMANVVPLVAARRAAANWDVRQGGVGAPGALRLRVYATRETHTWLQKAVDMAGLGTDSVHWIDTRDHERMDPTHLACAIAEDRARGELPMAIVATAGTVSTGAVDPLREIGEIAAAEKIWLHIDGCYGGMAACVKGAAADLDALALGDSLALDPHKWLYAPLEAGAVLVRDAERLRDAYSYQPPYYQFGPETNFFDFGPQNSRGFRALKVYLALRHVGREGYVQMIGDDIELSRRLAKQIEAHPQLELFTQNLSITTFRYLPHRFVGRTLSVDDQLSIDQLNRALTERLQRSGEAFLSHAIVGGRYVLRPCIVNFHTQPSDLSAIVDLVVRLGDQLAAEAPFDPPADAPAEP